MSARTQVLHRIEQGKGSDYTGRNGSSNAGIPRDRATVSAGLCVLPAEAPANERNGIETVRQHN